MTRTTTLIKGLTCRGRIGSYSSLPTNNKTKILDLCTRVVCFPEFFRGISDPFIPRRYRFLQTVSGEDSLHNPILKESVSWHSLGGSVALQLPNSTNLSQTMSQASPQNFLPSRLVSFLLKFWSGISVLSFIHH